MDNIGIENEKYPFGFVCTMLHEEQTDRFVQRTKL